MSKYLKHLITQDLQNRLEGVNDALLVNVIGLESNDTTTLRAKLREKGIHLLAVKTTLARRATEGTPLEAAFKDVDGAVALCWGCEDFVSLAKEVTAFSDGKEYEEFVTCGGVMDGEQLTPARVKEISKWPNRAEQLSILSGQISGVGGKLVAAINGPAGALASQIESKAKDGE
ncbi:MAG: 50S ribosomal protein L10 [Planctomycetales bacterium]|nr:50S ribosomal protein L10 [Planctomycetales bacterium]